MNTPIPIQRAAPFLRFLRTQRPVALSSVACQTASVRRASHLRKARFNASTNALAPVSFPAPSPQSSTKNSALRSAWHHSNRHSVAALSPDILPSASETRGTTTCTFSAQTCLRFLDCAHWLSFFPCYVPLIPVDCIPDEGVHQRNVNKDRSQPPKVLVIGSVKDVADSASQVQFSGEAFLHIDSRGEASLLPACFHTPCTSLRKPPARVWRSTAHDDLPRRAPSHKGTAAPAPSPRDVKPKRYAPVTPLRQGQGVRPPCDGVWR